MFGRRGPFQCISGYPNQNFPEGGPLGLRFNPAPGWPPPPPGFVPPPHWQPDPSWPPPPPGWQLWLAAGAPDPRQPSDPPTWAGQRPPTAAGFAAGSSRAPAPPRDF